VEPLMFALNAILSQMTFRDWQGGFVEGQLALSLVVEAHVGLLTW